MAESKLASPIKLWKQYLAICVQYSINMFSMLSPLSVFWYQILLLPICSCIHFQAWFYFTWPHLFYTEGVLVWDYLYSCLHLRDQNHHQKSIYNVFRKIPMMWFTYNWPLYCAKVSYHNNSDHVVTKTYMLMQQVIRASSISTYIVVTLLYTRN